MADVTAEKKRSKKTKSGEKKRHRDEEDDATKKHDRKHKRSKSEHVAEAVEDVKTKSSKKSKKHSSKQAADEAADGDEEVTEKHRKKSKSKPAVKEEEEEGAEEEAQLVAKKHKKKKKPSKRRESHEQGDPMDVDTPTKPTTTTTTDDNKEALFPFFTQIISLYLPLYPVGFDKPLSSMADQYLARLVSHYSPQLGGVLLGYRNVVFSETPTRRPDPHRSDETPALVESINEFAVGFGWLTAEIDLFVPRRNADMEGTLILQSEGHLGLNCWGKFNASIEAKRLPRGWKYIDVAGGAAEDAEEAAEDEEEEMKKEEEDAEPVREEGAVGTAQPILQMHQTGYWVDESNRKIKGTLRFRIKSYEVGLQGDHGFISIEGTMLGVDAEREVAAAELEAERRRRLRHVGSRRAHLRRVPEFSMTKFGKEDEKEERIANQHEPLKGSRPVSPID